MERLHLMHGPLWNSPVELMRCLLLVSGFLLPTLCHADAGDVTPEQREFFEKSIRPVLAEHCYKCHGPKKQEADLRLDSRAALLAGGQTGAAIVPGKPEESELILAISYDASGYQMPPTGKLHADQIAALTKWVKMGAPWPGNANLPLIANESQGIDVAERAKHWSFQPVKPAQVPAVKDASWPKNAVDRFILARLEEAGLKPAEATDRRTWLRRVTFDLIGLPPTASEVQDFLSDNSPDAYTKVVDRLLASPAYGERWARHWLDLVRFAETSGHEFDYDIEHAWPYRDYVVRAFNADVPYDEFVVEHIAGDLLPEPRRHPVTGTNESIVGTGFYWFGQGKHSPVDIRAEECDCIDNQIDVLGKTFLGLTIACARCHDHKFDPITANDYYALAGYLQSSRRQHAFIDPPDSTRAIFEELQKVQHERSQLIAATLADLVSDPKAFENLLRSHIEAIQKDSSNPFHAWAALTKPKSGDEFLKAKQQLATRYSDQMSREANIIDLSPQGTPGWMPTGSAFRDVSIPAGTLSTNAEKPALVLPGTISSGTRAGGLQGTLRSPTFTITKPYILYRMQRTGGQPAPGRATKNGQVHLIVDGFQLIKNPLYGHLTINVKQEDSNRWYAQDVSKFVGAKAYIEVQDEDKGELHIDRIIAADSPAAPLDSPNELVLAFLNDPQITSAAGLLSAYRSTISEMLNQWRTNQWDREANPRDRIMVLNALLDLVTVEDVFTLAQKTAWKALNRRLQELDGSLPEPHRAIAMVDGTAEDANLLIRGNHQKPGAVVPRRFLEVFQPEPQPIPTGSGRLDLAERIASRDNPLTARVLVNRLWLHHFGRGIVATPDDFGKMGQEPTHPELLDWLAAEFIRSGWSIKHMHRLMVLSNTYRLTSRLEPKTRPASNEPLAKDASTIDPDNRLLHRMPVRRLEGEAIRDAILANSGRLNRQMEGPSVLPHLTPFMEGRGRPSKSGPLDGEGRRSLYINVRRNFLTPLFLAFDFPTPFTTMGRRTSSNVPAQGLTMMNNPFIIQQARVWADRVLAEIHPNSESRIRRLYEMAYTRPPSETELAAAKHFLETQGREYGGPDDPRAWADLCHVLMNVKEFSFIQ